MFLTLCVMEGTVWLSLWHVSFKDEGKSRLSRGVGEEMEGR